MPTRAFIRKPLCQWRDLASRAASLAVVIGLSLFAVGVEAEVIYYSVGTDNTSLYSDTASAASGTLTLNSPAADRIGVGDEIREGLNRYYITGRNSTTVFTIQNSAANGGTPGDTNISFASTAITIFRAFNTLSDATRNSDDGTHLGLRFLSKKNDVWFPKLKPVPVMGTEKENHTSWERYYRVSDCSSSSRNNWYLGR